MTIKKFSPPSNGSPTQYTVRQALTLALANCDEYDKCLIIMARHDATEEMTYCDRITAGANLLEQYGLLGLAVPK